MISNIKKIGFIGVIASILFTHGDDKNPEENYAEYCSGCHGAKMEAFADRGWKYGKDLASITKSIKYGYPDGGMSAYDTTFSDAEITALANYLKQGLEARESYDFSNTFDADKEYEYLGQKIKVKEISTKADIPWGIAFLPEGEMLITDREGDIYLRDKQGFEKEIIGAPEVVARGQGGLLDVEIDPFFKENRIIYLSYSKKNPKGDGQTTAIMKAFLSGTELQNQQDIFIALPYLPTRHHYGSRMEFGPDGMLYFTVGDRGRRNDNPQNLDNACGKIHRIMKDGSIPSDNPFYNTPGAVPSIWSYGHRNPQGLVWDFKNKTLWSNEHGPRGGDEINIIEKGKNYGWPEISYGINYNGTTFTNLTHKEGMVQPTHYWTPSIGVCGMTVVNSNIYPAWKDYTLSGSLRFDYVGMIKNDTKAAVDEEIKILPNIGRVRSVVTDRDGYLYVGVEEPGRIYKILPLD